MEAAATTTITNPLGKDSKLKQEQDEGSVLSNNLSPAPSPSPSSSPLIKPLAETDLNAAAQCVSGSVSKSESVKMSCFECKGSLIPHPRGTWGDGWTCDWPGHKGANRFTANDVVYGCATVHECSWGVCRTCHYEVMFDPMLFWASEHGDVELILKLAEKNVDLNVQDEVTSGVFIFFVVLPTHMLCYVNVSIGRNDCTQSCSSIWPMEGTRCAD